MDLNRTLQLAEQYSLSDDDIREYLKDDVNIVSYLDLPSVHRLQDLFKTSDNLVIHIPVQSQSAGHWTCAWLTGSGDPLGNTFNYWCPYAFTPYENITKSPYLMHSEDKNDFALVYLIKQFLREGGKVSVNKYKIQQLKNGVNTCGRHVVARLLHKQLNNKQYYEYITSLEKNKK